MLALLCSAGASAPADFALRLGRNQHPGRRERFGALFLKKEAEESRGTIRLCAAACAGGAGACRRRSVARSHRAFARGARLPEFPHLPLDTRPAAKRRKTSCRCTSPRIHPVRPRLGALPIVRLFLTFHNPNLFVGQFVEVVNEGVDRIVSSLDLPVGRFDFVRPTSGRQLDY